jgi:hypothetical protein
LPAVSLRPSIRQIAFFVSNFEQPISVAHMRRRTRGFERVDRVRPIVTFSIHRNWVPDVENRQNIYGLVPESLKALRWSAVTELLLGSLKLGQVG